MTNETRKRIEAYEKMLPDMKERIAAVAILLVMSISMMISASFAWLTISRNPEVTSVSTTVAANGNLEIALATGDVNSAQAPDESEIGDSSATKGQSVVSSNITWGNLVNLSDPSYGLDHLTLRPAQLNQSSLLVSPLYGAVYKGDGRVEKLNSSFGYATWDPVNQIFMIKDDIGVRAISSVTVEAVGFAQQVYDKRNEAESANLQAGSIYTTITKNSDYMNTLAIVMGTYMTARMNSDDASLSNPTIDQKDVINLRDLFKEFIDVYDAQFEAMAKMANYQLFLLNNSEEGSTPYREKTAQDIMDSATTEATLKKEKIQINGLNTAKADYTKLKTGYDQLVILAEQGSVKWADSGLTNIVNSLMNTGTCTLDDTPVNNIGASNAMGYLDGETHSAKITNGVLFNFEKLNGTRCDVRGLSVSAKVKRLGMTIPASITVNITTSAPQRSQFVGDLEDYADKLNKGAKGQEVAQDTYGLAVDLWVRTNATNSYLTLEGNVLTKSELVRATTTDINGNTVELFVLTRSSEEEKEDGTTETVSYNIDVYKVVDKDASGQEVETWYYASSHSTIELQDGESPTAKMTELVTVIGFEGENRVWEDSSQMSTDATTQGSGSCYVYYADTPEDQARSLKLLESMNVAFIDDKGNLMATAIMDTERFYAENGRVTVPLVLNSESLKIGMDDEGDSIYAITPLVQNEAKRITAIVYLDGTKLTNKDVLAASDIQGKLNIQFGSSVTLSHAEDEILFNATRTVSASIDKTNFKYDESIESGTPMRSTVTVRVDGDEPTAVTGFFIRAISSTQGSREEKITFDPQADGTWTASYDFSAPGNYVLRSVELDGQTYDLAEKINVTVEGFTVQSLECTQAVGRHVSIMTADASSVVDLKLKFASDLREAMPTTVQGRFLRKGDGSAVNISFTYNANSGYWTGQANFISSGEYTLEFLVLNGEYAQLEESMIQSATVYLGMKTAIYTDSPVRFLYIPDELTENQKNLKMKVKIMDNTGNEMQGLQNVHLYYRMEGSSANGMDAPMTWNGTYYTCTFPAKIGVYRFSRITVGSNTITYATESPTFQIMSPNPPSYDGFVNESLLFDEKGGLTMKVRLTDSAGTTVAAMIRNLKDSKVYEVQGSVKEDKDGVQIWQFLIPTTSDGKQDGNWRLDEVKIWNFYDESGNYVSAEVDSDGNLTEETETNRDEPLAFYPDNQITKAVTTINVKVNLPADYDAHLGNSAASGNNVTSATANGTFLETQTVNVPTVTFVDFEGEAIGEYGNDGKFNSLISGVKFVYDYDGQSQTYGGYTSAATAAKPDVLTVNMISTDGKNFTQSGTVSVQYAGVYTPDLVYTIGGQTNVIKTASDMGTTAPIFAVWSKAPTATISAVTPTGSNPAKLTYTTKNLDTCDGGGTEPTFTATGNQTSTFSAADNTATLYAVATADNSTQRHGSFTQPTVTLTIAGVTADSDVQLTLPAGSANAVVFARTGNGTVKATLGKKEQIKSWTSRVALTHTLDAYYGHGTQTIIDMTVTSGNVSYTVTLEKPIVITNQSSVNQ